jgi:hypothetical protein
MNLRAYAKGKPCLIRIPNVCNGNPETVVLCHLRMAGISGMGLKANDLLGAWGCSACHRYVDTHGIDGRTALLEGMARTQAEILKLRREPPHCSTCECGLELLPEAEISHGS